MGNRLTNAVGDEDSVYDQNDKLLEPLRTEDYGYDELYRLTSVSYGGGHNQGYTFDPMGNRLTKTDSLNGNESYGYNAANMIESRGGVTYTSDTRGNITDEVAGGITVRHNVWDLQNRLRQCTYNGTTSVFTYGADGLRRSMTVGANPTVHYALDGQSVAQEGHLDNGDFIADITYLNGPRGPECKIDASGNATWYIFDGLGSVVAEANDTGTVTATKAYDVYGIPRGGNGTPSTKHGFVGSLGHTAEPDTGGLIYMRARWMDPLTGRFISEDPAYNGTNWYVYCGNNPVNLVDPDGKAPYMLELVVGGILILLGQYLVRHTEESGLAYILGISGTAIGGVLAIGAIIEIAEIAAPIFRNWVDGLNGDIWKKLEKQSQEQSSSLTERVVSMIYGQQLVAAGYMLNEGMGLE